MSGPKSSRYTLTAEQRRILEEQRRIEAAKAVARERIKRNNDILRRLSISSEHDKVIIAEALSRLGSDGGYSKKIEELIQLTQEAETIFANTDSTNLTSLESTFKYLSESIKKAEGLKREIQDIVSDCEKKLNRDIADVMSEGFSVAFEDDIFPDTPTLSDSLKKMMKEINTKIGSFRNQYALSDELLSELDRVSAVAASISDEQFLKNYIAVTINPLLKKCIAYDETYKQYHEEYEKLYMEYNALCELYHYDVQEVPFSAEAIDYLKGEIERINKAAQQQEEQEYIQSSIDEVMAEMGYSVIGSREVTKKNGNHFRNELYTFSDGTAVNVTYSSDGRIVMELGGLDSKDRIPDEYESAALCEEMQVFCKDFKEIEKRLIERGVILASRISLLPPDKAYAQIINTTDYDMRTDTDSFTAEKHRRKAVKKKTMKAE